MLYKTEQNIHIMIFSENFIFKFITSTTITISKYKNWRNGCLYKSFFFLTIIKSDIITNLKSYYRMYRIFVFKIEPS